VSPMMAAKQRADVLLFMASTGSQVCLPLWPPNRCRMSCHGVDQSILFISVMRVSNPGGTEDWVVACRCGTLDDDGERMVACDACGSW
jgi:hypothetical protein